MSQRYCCGCAGEFETKDLYPCGRCRKSFHIGCLDLLHLSFCAECAVIVRRETLDRLQKAVRAREDARKKDKVGARG